MSVGHEIDAKYQEGRITLHEGALSLLCLVKSPDATDIFKSVSEDLIQGVREYLTEYFPGKRVYGGVAPTIEQVEFAKVWFECNASGNSE